MGKKSHAKQKARARRQSAKTARRQSRLDQGRRNTETQRSPGHTRWTPIQPVWRAPTGSDVVESPWKEWREVERRADQARWEAQRQREARERKARHRADVEDWERRMADYEAARATWDRPRCPVCQSVGVVERPGMVGSWWVCMECGSRRRQKPPTPREEGLDEPQHPGPRPALSTADAGRLPEHAHQDQIDALVYGYAAALGRGIEDQLVHGDPSDVLTEEEEEEEKL